jgi:hypothetical protein
VRASGDDVPVRFSFETWQPYLMVLPDRPGEQGGMGKAEMKQALRVSEASSRD